MKFIGRNQRTNARGRSYAKIAAALVALLVLGVMASGALADGDPLSALTAITGTSISSDGSGASSTSSDTTGTSADESTTTSSDGTLADTTTSDSTASETTTSETTTGVTLTPLITTDKSDYEPGSTVTLEGSGWGAGESVHLFVNDTIGQTWQYNTDVVADLSGDFTATFQLPNTFISNYDVTATGAAGEKATTTFTDGNAMTVSGTVTDSITHLGIAGATLTCSTSNGCNGTISTTTDPSGNYVFDNSTTKLSFATNGPVTLKLTVSKSGYATGTITLANVNNSDMFTHQDIALVASCAAAGVATQPVDQNVFYGTDATFTAAGSGSPSPTIQWQVSSNGTTFSDVTGATNTSLTLPKPAVSLSGNKYRAVFTNTCGGTQTATSNAVSLTVNKRPITVTAASNAKDYDRTTTAAAIPTITTGTLVMGDTANFSEAYQTSSVGTGKTLVPSGSVSDGNGGNNYAVTLVNNTTGVINKRPITVAAATNSKAYDGGTSASAVPTITSGSLLSGDSASFSEAYQTSSVGTGKTLVPSGSVSDGNGGNNYAIAFVNNATGVVSQRNVTASITAVSKVYDGTPGTSANCALNAQSGNVGVVAGEGSAVIDCAATGALFDTAAAGSGKTVTANVALTGTGAGNYSLTSAAATDPAATISKRPVTASIVAAPKVYDGGMDTTATCVLEAQAAGHGVVGSDDVSCLASGALFASAAAGTHAVTADVALQGDAKDNYSLTSAAATDPAATISKRPVTASIVAAPKVYDGTDAASLTGCSLEAAAAGHGVVGSDAVGCDGSNGHFDSAAAGSGKTVTADVALSGDAKANYQLSSAAAATTADISPATLTVSFQVLDKVWDGTTSATIKSSPAPSLAGIIGMDDVTLGSSSATATFATIAVGSGKTVIGTGFTKGGSDAGNYVFETPQGTTIASILAWNAAGKGFYAPVGADAAHSVFTPGGIGTPTTKPGPMTWNTIKGGQTVPLKFNVFAGTVEKAGNDAFPGSDPTKAFQMQKLANCVDSLDIDQVDFVASTGQTVLRYDTTGKQWIENWATQKVSVPTCYRTFVTFADGSTLEAFFQLTK